MPSRMVQPSTAWLEGTRNRRERLRSSQKNRARTLDRTPPKRPWWRSGGVRQSGVVGVGNQRGELDRVLSSLRRRSVDGARAMPGSSRLLTNRNAWGLRASHTPRPNQGHCRRGGPRRRIRGMRSSRSIRNRHIPIRTLSPSGDRVDRVLDLDRFELHSFSDLDDHYLRLALEIAGFTPTGESPSPPPPLDDSRIRPG